MKSIPVLPKEVEFSHINNGEINLDFIPVGISKKELCTANIKLKDEVGYLLSFREFDENIPFIDKFLHILDNGSINTFILDTKYIYEEPNFKKAKYLNSNYSDAIKQLNKYVEEVYTVFENNNNNIRTIKQVESIVCVIIGFNKFIESLSEEDKNVFINILKKTKEVLKVHFVFIDIPSGFKLYEYESWYKTAIDSSTGLWVGNGFGEQFLIQPTKVIQSYYDVIGNNYGYIVDKGQVKFIKIVEKM